MTVRPSKTQISMGIRPVWSESLLSAGRNLGPLATHWAHSEDSDQTGWMHRLIWVFAGHTLILLALSCRGSYIISTDFDTKKKKKKENVLTIIIVSYLHHYKHVNCHIFKNSVIEMILFWLNWIVEKIL